MPAEAYRIGSKWRISVLIGGVEHIISPEEAKQLALDIYVASEQAVSSAADAEVASWK